jgi:hypothetical protein
LGRLTTAKNRRNSLKSSKSNHNSQKRFQKIRIQTQ